MEREPSLTDNRTIEKTSKIMNERTNEKKQIDKRKNEQINKRTNEQTLKLSIQSLFTKISINCQDSDYHK